MPLSKTSPVSDSADCLNLSDFDLRLERYRIVQPKADQLLARSLSKYGQLAPVVYCQLDGAFMCSSMASSVCGPRGRSKA